MAIEAKKTPMPTQEAEKRIGNFEEVALGYPIVLAQQEAARCLNCKNRPCVRGCPVNIQIPDFIARIKVGDYEGAYRVIAQDSALPAVCGRVCPQESQCESKCTLGIKFEPVAIGRLERFAADWHLSHADQPPVRPVCNGHRAAVVGSGPSGLTCAGELARRGYDVTVFEALHAPGGVLSYGIPEFRLPKAIVAHEVENLRALGVKIETNVVIGKTLTVDELFEDRFEAVFIGSGAGLPRLMGIEGEGLRGVYCANEFLTRANLMKAYHPYAATPILRGGRVAVVGGGNVAMDAARTALRLGSKVDLFYRRSLEELPARREELDHAVEEGVTLHLLCNPVRIVGYDNPQDPKDPRNGSVKAMEVVRMELGEPDERGRRRPVEIPNSTFTWETDCVIMALGTSPNPLIKNTTDGLAVNRWGGIIADEETGATSRSGIYAGGDAVTGAATVILAMGAGKKAAAAIDRALCGAC